MKVGILGSGHVGQTLAAGFAVNGHDVMMGTGHPGKPELKRWLRTTDGTVGLGTFAEATAHGDVVVLACAGSAAMDVIDAAGDGSFDGKVLIDVTNPLEFNGGAMPGLFVGLTDSLGERVQRRLPKAKVVKALNTMNASTMTRPKMFEGLADVLIAGDDAAAKRAVGRLLREFGFDEPIDLGGIEAARWMEAWVPLWMRIADHLGNWKVALRVLRH